MFHQGLSLNSGLTIHSFTRTYFHRRDFCSYTGVHMPLPLLGLELQTGKYSPKLVKLIMWNQNFWNFIANAVSDESTVNFKGHVIFKKYEYNP
jgi:hypothetical protein